MSFSIKKSKVVSNASWIIICKIVQSVFGIVISSISARYLGPSNYGIIKYAASIAAFMLPIAQLGFNGILVKEFIENPNDEGKILGTALTLSLLTSLFCIFGTFLFSLAFSNDDHLTVVVCVLYSIMLIFQALELIIYWFQAHYISKYVSIVSLCSYLAVSFYKIYILATSKSIEWFAISNSIDYCLIDCGLLIIYKKKSDQKLIFSFGIAKKMLSRSWTYIISGLMAVIYAQTDIIMLNNIKNNYDVGIYSAAMTCVGLSSFVFSAIIDSMRPYVLEEKAHGKERFENSVIILYSIVLYLALLYCIFCFAFSDTIISLLFSRDYRPSAKLLRVVTWYSIFNYYGGAQTVWILAEEKQKYLTFLGTFGAALNVFLNCVLIPRFGVYGAAIATLLTSIFTNVILCAIIQPLRRTVTLFIKAFNPKTVISLIKKL